MRPDATTAGRLDKALADRLAPSCAALLGRIDDALGIVGGVLLAILLATVALAVVARYVFHSAIIGTDELAVWLHVFLVFVGFPVVSGSSLAMRLDVVSGRLPPAARAVADVVADAVVVHAALVFIVGGLHVIANVGGTSTSLGLPEWLRFAALPAAGALAIAVVPLRIVTAGRGVRAALAAVLLGIVLHQAASLLPAATAVPSAVAGAVAALAFALGAPLPHALIVGLSLAIPFGSLLPEAGIAQNTVNGVARFLLLAIPFFILTGVLLHKGGLGGRLVRFAAAMVGHRRSGLAQTTLLTNLLFAGVSGSSIADAAFGAKVLAPGLVAGGYPPPRAGAIVAATSILPNIEPLSIAFLILAAATQLSIGDLFLPGLVGGLIIAAVLSVALRFTNLEQPKTARADAGERRRAFLGALPVVGLGIVILAGIRFGVVTPTEAGAIAGTYAVIAGLALRGGLDGAGLVQAFREAGRAAAAVGLLVGSAAPFTFILAVDQLPRAITEVFTSNGFGPFGVMLVANLMLLVAGCVLDIGAAILLLAPLLLPVAVAVGLDPGMFGVILVINLMIHGLTPPIGILVLVTSGLMGVRPGPTFRAALPLVGVLFATVSVMAVAVATLAAVSAPSLR